jgi:biotin-(acetyl-CoA carboxylase) ligase
MINYNAKQYTENSSVNHNLTDTGTGINLDLTNQNLWTNTYIQNNSSNYKPYNQYRKDTEEILEMFTEAVKELSEYERELIKNKFYELFINKKIKINIEINDEEKI